ncbi:MAG: hypothetical protein ACKO5E_11835 [bacterium]
MSETASQLLQAFALLPPGEQHELLIALIRQSRDWPEFSLNDEQLVAVADELFQALDSEESDAESR